MDFSLNDGKETDRPASRDHRLWWLRAAMFLILIGCSTVWVYAGIWMKEQGVGESFIGTLVGAGGVLAAASALFWGWLLDRSGRGTLIAAFGALLTGTGLVILSGSRSPIGFVCFQMCVSVGMSALLTLMPILALTVIGEATPGAGYSRFRIFGSFGYVVGLYLLPAIIKGIGHLCLIAGILMAVAALPLLLADVHPERHAQRLGLGGLIARRPFMCFIVALFFFGLGIPAVFTFLAIYAKSLGLGQVAVGWLMGMNGVLALGALPALGYVADRFGPRRVLLLAFMAMPMRILAQAAATGAVGLAAAQFFHIFTWAGLEVTVYQYVRRLAGAENQGLAVSAVTVTTTLAGLCAYPLTGYLAEHAGYRPMFSALAFLSALGLVTFLAAPRLEAVVPGAVRG